MSFGRSESTFQREMAERTMESLANRLLDLDSRIEVRNNEAIHAQTVTVGSETPGTDLNPIPNSASGSFVNDNRQHQNQFEVPATDMTDDMDTVKFVESMKNKNTLRKTKGELKKFEEYLCSVNEMRPVSEIDARGLDTYLARFFLSAKKNNGEEYEPDSLKSFQLSVNRHLNDKGIKMNLVEDVEFKHSRDVLMSKRKLLKQQGKGNRENKAEILSKDEINILYEKNLLGTGIIIGPHHANMPV